VNDPRNLSVAEFKVIRDLCRKTNMAVYAGKTGDDPDKNIPLALAGQFGLKQLDDNMGADDGITALRVVGDEWRGDYIPYTNRKISWHTDGYYNSLDKQIHSLLLHCVSPAASGGANALLDHEMAYIRLRQANPEYVRVLMEPDVMTIPANIDKDGTVIRPDRHGPVFTIGPDGQLHMRYTARKRNIIWRQNAYVQQAVKLLEDFMKSDSPYIYRGTLQSGQGLICNNVLHNRSAFEDDDNHHRLLYRLRYYDRMIQT
jgi:alpha-ketoglutarate-dependent taurine dioxygenase